MASPSIGSYTIPNSSASIDWNHPLANRLLVLVVRNSTDDRGTVYTNNEAILRNGLTSISISSGFTIIGDPNRTDANSYSSHSGFGSYVSGSDNIGIGLQWFETSNNICVVFRQDSNNISGAYTPTRPGNSLAYVYSGSGNTSVYENGVLTGSVQSLYLDITRLYSGTTFLYTSTPALTRSTSGRYVAVWLRPLSQSEIVTFQANPYCFLRY